MPTKPTDSIQKKLQSFFQIYLKLKSLNTQLVLDQRTGLRKRTDTMILDKVIVCVYLSDENAVKNFFNEHDGEKSQ